MVKVEKHLHSQNGGFHGRTPLFLGNFDFRVRRHVDRTEGNVTFAPARREDARAAEKG